MLNRIFGSFIRSSNIRLRASYCCSLRMRELYWLRTDSRTVNCKRYNHRIILRFSVRGRNIIQCLYQLFFLTVIYSMSNGSSGKNSQFYRKHFVSLTLCECILLRFKEKNRETYQVDNYWCQFIPHPSSFSCNISAC